jgi:hypothetical protein
MAPSRDDATNCQRCPLLERELKRLRAQARRDFDELEWRDEQIRVLKRVVQKLVQQEYRDKEPP